ncbi:hypothetical protein CFBP7900_16190 [Xanthomonas hortorum pv. carotae]|uniref:Uncharacterized protein n=1 Tax=Xanthomonas hortorum pv. carotae TaxID=487904 RepID=A0A6V7D014_9XANT|nr:hypothetical protein CFBP7900_16190 [Xanthomonas hortorum pv. carotae]CAD0325578.1 hypothetical protein CFBP7900_16190 [Xanthomonas hortorum pv. carotae]
MSSEDIFHKDRHILKELLRSGSSSASAQRAQLFRQIPARNLQGHVESSSALHTASSFEHRIICRTGRFCRTSCSAIRKRCRARHHRSGQGHRYRLAHRAYRLCDALAGHGDQRRRNPRHRRDHHQRPDGTHAGAGAELHAGQFHPLHRDRRPGPARPARHGRGSHPGTGQRASPCGFQPGLDRGGRQHDPGGMGRTCRSHHRWRLGRVRRRRSGRCGQLHPQEELHRLRDARADRPGR